MSQDLKFATSISGQTPQGFVLRQENLQDLISEADFVSTFFLSLVGRKPQKAEKIILNALLVSSIDHGINPASGFVPRVVAASGNNVLTAMASTLLSLGTYHGGAISEAMRIFEIIDGDGDDVEKACDRLISSYRVEKRRVSGYGHPFYRENDPRVKALFDLARKNELSIKFMNIARQLEHSLEIEFNKKLILNIDGAIAALLMTLGIDQKAGDAIFGLARVAGSVAHIIEEQNSGDWVRRLGDEDIEYKPE